MIIDTIKYGCTLCGIKYLVYKFRDKLCGTNITEELLYSCAKQANQADYEKLIKLQYKARTGKKLNLKNPKSFSEKIQWMKLYDSTPLKTMLADKYLARAWVAEKIGEEYLIPLLGVWDSFDEIDFNVLPEQFVLKANHGCGWNAVVKDKSALNLHNIKGKFDKWIDTNYAFVGGNLELHYKDIPPKIIAETYIEQVDKGLYDYKIHVFGGKAEIVQVIGNRDLCAHTGRQAFFDKEWNKSEIMNFTYPSFNSLPLKPENLDEMVHIAEVLANEFAYVRVDLYDVDGRIFFGEMTFTPSAGFGKWISDDIDAQLGEMINTISMEQRNNII